ncbi:MULTISPECIES: hypothetical protein [unclassified Duganella]|uniref:hypothetical protein n=1 Tax=unclassified Duganella TaxID=2636909 RepID=UPI0008848DF9|nr:MULTISPECIES: hypothetical protein [unclassified Duganella]SDF80536.1 hypothetical protein SAMN05216320_1011378 [Duganella sp. OV458]SDI48735.1 hypothetical protein SAMN05428973_10137 [Duganella sp. OV510]
MIYDLSRAERQHRAIANEKPGPVLESKRCACSKASPAKVLAQYGKCHGCQLADRIATLHDGDLEILRHMVGATDHHPRARWGFRNEYLVNRRDLPSMERLAAAGFVRAGAELLQLQYFHATVAGCKLAGLSAKRTEVALSLGARP